MSRGLDLDLPHEHSRHRDDGGGHEMPRGGRGAGSDRPREREALSPRDALAQQLDLPCGDGREQFQIRERSCHLRGSEVRTLAAIGAFRIVDARDLGSDRELAHLKESGLVEIRSAQFRDGERTAVVTLTKDGKELLEKHQWPRHTEPRQEFYSGLAKPREASHDAQLYRAYEKAATRLQAGGARIHRVVIDYELKRDYQRFLQAHNRGNRHASGKPDRSREEIQEWVRKHDLPMVGDHVQFPNVRIEYEGSDGRDRHEDVELTTEHYNSRQMGAKRSSGFTMHRGGSSQGRGSSPFDPHAAEKVLR